MNVQPKSGKRKKEREQERQLSVLRSAIAKEPLLAQQHSREDGYTPLQRLLRSGNQSEVATECIQFLLKTHPEATQQADANGWLPLHLAMRYASAGPATLQLLIDANPAAAQHKTLNGLLPMHLAVMHIGCGDYVAAECVRLLLKAYPAAAHEPTPSGYQPLHYVAWFMGGDAAAACMRMLLEAHPAAAGTKSTSGDLPLHLLAQNEADPPAAVVRVLVDAFPEALSAKDEHGLTPLQTAGLWRRLSAEALAELRRLTEGMSSRCGGCWAVLRRGCPLGISLFLFLSYFHTSLSLTPCPVSITELGTPASAVVGAGPTFPSTVKDTFSSTAAAILRQTLSGDDCEHTLSDDDLEETVDANSSDSSSEEDDVHFVAAASSSFERSATDVFDNIRFMKAAGDPELAGLEVIVANVWDLREALERDRRLAQTKTDDGWTALQCLIRFGAGYRAVDCAWLLLDAHPSAAQEPTPDGWLPLHLALRPLESAEPAAATEPDSRTGLIVESYMLEILSLLLSSYPTAVSEKVPNGDLPLHLAARYTGGFGSVECMYMLLQAHPAAAQERNADGDLPLHIAARDMHGSRSAECMRLLLQVYPAGAQEQSSAGSLPLHSLVETKSDYDAVACVRVLAAAYPPALQHKNPQGQTPLEIAEQWMQAGAEVLAELRRLSQGGELYVQSGSRLCEKGQNMEEHLPLSPRVSDAVIV